MKSCKECDHALFDPRFGEYKCSKKERVVTVWYDVMGCPDYILNKGELHISKDTHEEDEF